MAQTITDDKIVDAKYEIEGTSTARENTTTHMTVVHPSDEKSAVELENVSDHIRMAQPKVNLTVYNNNNNRNRGTFRAPKREEAKRPAVYRATLAGKSNPRGNDDQESYDILLCSPPANQIAQSLKPNPMDVQEANQTESPAVDIDTPNLSSCGDSDEIGTGPCETCTCQTKAKHRDRAIYGTRKWENPRMDKGGGR